MEWNGTKNLQLAWKYLILKWKLKKWKLKIFESAVWVLWVDINEKLYLQGGPERSNLAVFTIEGGLDSKFSYVK